MLTLNLSSSLSPRLGLSLIMIVKETERTEEKKEKQKKKQKQIIKRRNERKNIELDSPNVASEMPWRCPLLSFFDFGSTSSGTERRRYRNEGLGGFLGPSASR